MILRSRSFLGALAIAVSTAACGGGAGGFSVASFSNHVTFPPAERKPAPALAGESLRPGPAIAADAIAGKVAVVNFWGSWCGPCRREQAFLERAWKAYRSQGVAFVGVNSRRDQHQAALAYLDEFHVTYPSIFDPSSQIAYRFGIRYMPVTYVLDKRRRVAAIFVGAISEERVFTAVLDAELAS